MTERVLPVVAYETLLIEEAKRAAGQALPGYTFEERGNRWGCPLFVCGFDVMEVALVGKKDGGKDQTVRVDFAPEFAAARVEWYDNDLNEIEKKVKLDAGFLVKFREALQAEYAGRDLFKLRQALTKKAWYNKADWNAAENRDAALHHRFDAALMFCVAVSAKGTPIVFEYRKKRLTGTFQGFKRWRKAAFPGGDPASGFQAVLHCQGMRYQVGAIFLKGFAKAA